MSLDKYRVQRESAAEQWEAFLHESFINVADPSRRLKLFKEFVLVFVEAGGHDVPRDKLRNRFPRTLKNLGRTISVLPRVTIYDNSTFGHPFLFVAEFREQKLAQRRDGKIPPWARRFVR